MSDPVSTPQQSLPDGRVASILFPVKAHESQMAQIFDGNSLQTFQCGSNGYTLAEAQSRLEDTEIEAYKGSGDVSTALTRAKPSHMRATGRSSAIEVSAHRGSVFNEYESPSGDVILGGSWVLSDSSLGDEDKILLLARVEPASVDPTDAKTWLTLLQQELLGTHVLLFGTPSGSQSLLSALSCNEKTASAFLHGPLIPDSGSEFQRASIKGELRAYPLGLDGSRVQSSRSTQRVKCTADTSLVKV